MQKLQQLTMVSSDGIHEFKVQFGELNFVLRTYSSGFVNISSAYIVMRKKTVHSKHYLPRLCTT